MPIAVGDARCLAELAAGGQLEPADALNLGLLILEGLALGETALRVAAGVGTLATPLVCAINSRDS
jgi:hypothetical protein